MKRLIAVLISALICAACDRTGIPSPGDGAQNSNLSPASVAPLSSLQHVYWTLGADENVQMQYTKAPLHESSRVSSIYGTDRNRLRAASGLWVNASGKELWALSFGSFGYSPTELMLFRLPLQQTSAPLHHFVLSGTNLATYLAFDAKGNLWVNSKLNNSVLEYVGPFKRSGTLSPHFKLTRGLNRPSGLAFDAKGNLYVSNFASRGKHSIAVFESPVSNKEPHFLNGLTYPGGLIFDKSGNLYGSSNGPSRSATVRYDRSDLRNGDRPSIIDYSGLYHSYGTTFGLSASGDLYLTNCGEQPSIFVYPTGERRFAPGLKPSVDYTDYEIETTRCVWGISIN